MNAPSAVLPDIATSAWVAALVRTGLAAFAAHGQVAPEELVTALQREAEDLGGGLPQRWPDLCAALYAAWPLAEGRLGALIADFGVSPAGLFLLGLAGAVEESHLVTLTLDKLQAPASNPRPTVHLALAAVAELFGVGVLDVHRLQSHEFVRRGVLVLEGDVPMPLRTLRLHPVLWSLLNGHGASWPGCTPVAPPGAGEPGSQDGDGSSSRADPGLATGSCAGSPWEVLPQSLLNELPKLAALMLRGEVGGMVLRGTPGSGRALLGAALARAAGLSALEVPPSLWEQEPGLAVACRYGDWLPMLSPRLGPGELWEPPPRPGVGPMLVLLGLDGAVAGRNLMEVELPLLREEQRRSLWTAHLGDPDLGARAANALLGGPVIAALATQASLLAERAGEAVGVQHIGEARALLGAERLRLLAQPVARRVGGEALVMPPQLVAELDATIARARLRESVLQGLGATLQATPNPGLRLLLVGESGTGKTLIASYLATALGAPLYRVDLAAVMNKYIGESEKNLGALLDQAAAHDVVLLFDEADSLFGRRSDRKETGERYANMLTNFLLTRIENHPGIVVLTTNSRERIDTAFTRRLDQIIEVPLPGFDERLRLWRSHLGERGPDDAVCRQLAGYCELAGGQVRNAVLTASALAGGGSIGLPELLRGLRGEYRKIGRGLPAPVERMDQASTKVHALTPIGASPARAGS